VQYGLGAALASPLLALGLLVVVLQRRAIGDNRRFVVGRDRAPGSGKNSPWRLLPVLAYAGALLLPLLAIIHVALSPFWSGDFSTKDYTLRNFRTVLGDERVYASIRTSVIAALIAICVIIPVTFLAALALAPGSKVGRTTRNVIDFAVNLPVGIPATVFGFGILFTYSEPPFRLYGTIAVVIIVYVTIMLPFATRLMLAALLSQGVDYREASAVSGASPLRTVWRIIAPLARSGITSAAILVFILLTHEFSASLMVRSPNMQVVGALLYEYYSLGSYPKVAVLSLLLVAVTLVGVALARIVGGRDATRRAAKRASKG
jgi:iron(III) transport system permease protein